MKQIYYTILGVLCLIISDTTIAQKTFVNREWANTTGTVGTIHRTVADVDHNKNVIVVSNTVFSPNNTDVLITKYDSNGVLLWQETFDGTGNGNDYGVQVKIGSDNSIYIAAALQGTTSIDFGVLKYNSNGILAWSNTWNNTNDGIDVPADIEVDVNGNVYLVGGSQSSNVFSDYAIVKYNSSGVFQWDTTYDYADLHDAATSLKVDVSNVVVTGASASSSENWDYATLQINSANGVIDNIQRTAVTGVGLDNALAVTSDDDNNIYVTGFVEISGNRNIQTVKINSDFGLEWVRNFDGGLEDIAKSIGVDDFGNVYITGHTEKPNGGRDFITIKYDSYGTQQWSKEYGSAGGVNNAEAKQLDITSDGDVIITGSVDIDGVKNFATIKYNSDGELKFNKDYDAGSGDNIPESIIVKDNEIFVSGTSSINGVKQSSTVKYTTQEKPLIIETDSLGNRFVADELIIRFDKSAIISNSIYQKEFTAGILSDFVKPEVWSEMGQKLGFSCKGSDTYKIFLRMTPADSICITRLGEEIKVDEYWATLSVFFDSPINDEVIIDSLESMNAVQFVERNYIGELFETPNDDLYNSEQIGLQDSPGGINVEDAWDIQTGKTHIKVGTFDSGINWQHEDFGDGTQNGTKVAGGWNFDNNVSVFNDGFPAPHGHGTATSGIIGALRNNNAGGAGIAGGNLESDVIENTGAQLFSFKITTGSSGNIITNTDVAPAIIEGAFHSPNNNYGYKLHVQNHSWGSSVGYSSVLRNAVNFCYRSGCVFVAASGNTGSPTNYLITDDVYPASYNDNLVIKVGANNFQGERASFSVSGNDLDFIAPGVPTLYAAPDNDNNSTYTYNEPGTSFAAPMASGVAALMLSEHNPLSNDLYPNPLSPDDVEYLLENTATDILPPNYDFFTGHGKVDAHAAIIAGSLPYRVRHFHEMVNTSNATYFDTHNYLFFPNGILTVITTDIYKLTTTLTYTIPSNENYIDGWARNSTCFLFNYEEDEYFGVPPIEAGVNTDNSDQNSITLTGYIYNVLPYTVYGETYGGWFPTTLNTTTKFAYSIYTEENTNVGIDEDEIDLISVDFYPNPVENKLTISYHLSSNSDIEASIIDNMGKIILVSNMKNQTKGDQNFFIDMSKLEKGIYLCKIQIGAKIFSKQIIKI